MPNTLTYHGNSYIFTQSRYIYQVNNLIIQQLLDRTKAKTLSKFLTTDLSGITSINAKRLLERLGNSYDENMNPSDMSDKLMTRLTQLLRSADDLFKSPDGGCLSPLGEYNLNLGIQKVRLFLVFNTVECGCIT